MNESQIKKMVEQLEQAYNEVKAIQEQAYRIEERLLEIGKQIK